MKKREPFYNFYCIGIYINKMEEKTNEKKNSNFRNGNGHAYSCLLYTSFLSQHKILNSLKHMYKKNVDHKYGKMNVSKGQGHLKAPKACMRKNTSFIKPP